MEAPLDQPPTIDVDVFNLILACLPQADLLKITLVSHFAREESIKELFMRPIRLRGNENLRKFCQFALAGDPRRLSCLQNLTIDHIEDEGSFSSEEREMVARVLTYCTSLRKLELRSCDELIMEDSVIFDIISALPSLAHLAVWMCRHGQTRQDVLLRMVLNMKVSLRSLHFSMLSDGLPKVKELQDLARVHRHLEELTLQLSIFTCPGVSFSAVRKLQLVLDHDIPQLRDVYRTFPNVRDLSIEHDQNMDAEVAPPSDSGSCWPSLDRLQAFPSIIYNLGISCPVRDLELHCYYSDTHEKFSEVVSRLRPSKLTFSLYFDLDCRWAVPHAHPSLLLHGTADAGVKHLFVKAPYSTSRPLGTQDFMDYIRPQLRTARVELLHVAICELSIPASEDPDEMVDPPIKLNRKIHVPDIDAEILAGEWARACASIRTVAITIALMEHSVWRVERVDGEVKLVKLGSFEGRRVMEEEAKRCSGK